MPAQRGSEPWRLAAFDVIRLADESRYLSEPAVLHYADGSRVFLDRYDFAALSAESNRELSAFRERLLALKLALWDAVERVSSAFDIPLPSRVYKLCAAAKQLLFDAEPLPDYWSTPEYRDALRDLLDDPDHPVCFPDQMYGRWREFANTFRMPRRVLPNEHHAATQPPKLTEPVCVADIAKNLPRRSGGGRSDKVADRLRRKGARMAKLAGKWHVEREDALRLLPAWRKYVVQSSQG